MDHPYGQKAITDGRYSGEILIGDYSKPLKQRLTDYIERYRAFEEIGSAAILYIAAWKGNDKNIWYEYASQQFMDLLGCDYSDVAETFRNSVKGHSIYKYMDTDVGIQKEVKNNEELTNTWAELREEGKEAGTIEAVYKISTADNNAVWLKDHATIEVYKQDNICLSPGFLTVVSKEMIAEDELKKNHDLLETLVKERTAELTELNKQLQQNLDETIHAMSHMAEERDPYTAGHQRRTTDLALALAKEMRLSEHQIKGIQMAGLIHDIGKISVPGEILNKPGSLNEPEIQLIQRHPQVAYEILNQIDFPWPVDQIVLQHHEKMDGSGYPNGLSSDEIMLEARILCVADVMETMEAHRPYRPGLGREAALEEISNNSGILYDSDVVDICLRLFKEKNFQYPSNAYQKVQSSRFTEVVS